MNDVFVRADAARFVLHWEWSRRGAVSRH